MKSRFINNGVNVAFSEMIKYTGKQVISSYLEFIYDEDGAAIGYYPWVGLRHSEVSPLDMHLVEKSKLPAKFSILAYSDEAFSDSNMNPNLSNLRKISSRFYENIPFSCVHNNLYGKK